MDIENQVVFFIMKMIEHIEHIAKIVTIYA